MNYSSLLPIIYFHVTCENLVLCQDNITQLTIFFIVIPCVLDTYGYPKIS